MEFIEILKNLLSESGMTQTAFANCIGVKQSQISEWLKGKAKPGYDTLKSIADSMNISADYLLGRTDELGGAILPAPSSDLSSEERKLVEDYRGLGKPLKDLLQSMIKTWQSDELPASSLSPRKKA